MNSAGNLLLPIGVSNAITMTMLTRLTPEIFDLNIESIEG